MLRMRPQPRSYMPGRAAWVSRNGAVSMISMSWRHFASGNSVSGATCCKPALLTRMSSRPPAAACASSTRRRQLAGSERSAATKRALGNRAASAWPRSTSRSARVTRAPASARARAMASPMPLAAPVTRAERPDRSVMWVPPGEWCDWFASVGCDSRRGSEPAGAGVAGDETSSGGPTCQPDGILCVRLLMDRGGGVGGEEGEERPAELVGPLDEGRVARVGDHHLLVAAAVSGVAVEQGAHLADHRLRRVGLGAGPAGDGAELAERAEVEQGGVGDDLVVGAADPEDIRAGREVREGARVVVGGGHRVVHAAGPGAH